MSNLDVWNMALSKERELGRSPRRQAQNRHLEDAIAQTRRLERERRGLLQRLWHATIGGLERRGTGSHLPHHAPDGGVGAANEVFLTYQPSDC
jgi:hypothetical protein